VANADNVVTIPKVWLESQITFLRGEKLAALDAALRFSLALPG
jgi:mRNA-degrading endonuclease toxin of MazEF toxin-antitoxin module